jgi:hypothetical protein
MSVGMRTLVFVTQVNVPKMGMVEYCTVPTGVCIFRCKMMQLGGVGTIEHVATRVLQVSQIGWSGDGIDLTEIFSGGN